jgi:trimeric autotransporter adhesin
MSLNLKLSKIDFKVFFYLCIILVFFPIHSLSADSDLITIEQVGDANDAIVRDINTTTTNTTTYNTNVLQDGNDNVAYIEQLGENISTKVQQFGNENEVRINVADGVTPPSAFTESTFPFDGNLNRRDIYQDGERNAVALTQIGDLNEASITQIGIANKAVVGQVSSPTIAFNNVATITQSGNENFASVTQGTEFGLGCDNCTATITQTGNNNGEPTLPDGTILTSIFQTGTDNVATITQSGNANNAKIAQGTEFGQDCDNCTATITQTGDGNGVIDPITGEPGTTIFQAGNDNRATITQAGYGNAAEISQGAVSGCENCVATITQVGNDNGVVNGNNIPTIVAPLTVPAGLDVVGLRVADGTRIVQEGSNLDATISQTGSGNLALIEQSNLTAGALVTADIIQNGQDNNAVITQNGFNNSANITQTGDTNYGFIAQVGDGLNAGITQNGNDNQAVIIQGGSNAPAVFIVQP